MPCTMKGLPSTTPFFVGFLQVYILDVSLRKHQSTFWLGVWGKGGMLENEQIKLLPRS
jgi:hypothetical protein